MRWRELEKEVREEMALEKALGIPMQMWFMDRLQMAPTPTQAKQDPNLPTAKRKAVSGSDPSGFLMRKKPKVEWSCPLCQVKATTESHFRAHLHGKKHKAKEKRLTPQNFSNSTEASLLSMETEKGVKTTETILTTTLGLDVKADKEMPHPCITLEDMSQTVADKDVVGSKNEDQLLQKNQTVGGLEDQNPTENVEARKTDALTTTNVTFRCEICQIFTISPFMMEDHKKGKNHPKQIKIFSQSNTSVLPISSVSQEAPGLIKYTVSVNKETDQAITVVVKEETILKEEEVVSDSCKSSWAVTSALLNLGRVKSDNS